MEYEIKKTVTASSYLNPFFPEKAINGVTDNANRWVTREPDGWIEVDLGCPCLFTKYTCDFLGKVGWKNPYVNVGNLSVSVGSTKGDNPTRIVDVVRGNSLSTLTRPINAVKTRRIRLSVAPYFAPYTMTSSIVNFYIEARPLSQNAYLTNVTTSLGNVEPLFIYNSLKYTINANGKTSIKIIPTSADPNAIIFVNGKVVMSGKESDAISVPATGSQDIKIRVIAEDEINSLEYTITVINDINTLSNITAKTGDGKAITLNPTFDPTKKDYAGEIEFSDDNFNVQSIIVVPTADNSVKITYNGQTVASGAELTIQNPVVGDNIFEITASKPDGSLATTYKVNIVRKHSLYIKSIVSTPGKVTPAVSKSISDYIIKGGRSESKVNVNIIAEDNSTKILVDIDGKKLEGTDGSVSFETSIMVEAKPAKVTVLSTYGTVQKNYILNISK